MFVDIVIYDSIYTAYNIAVYHKSTSWSIDICNGNIKCYYGLQKKRKAKDKLKRQDRMSAGTLLFIFIVGGGLYLLMVHPLIFWLVALPLGICFIVGLIKWIKKGGI